VGGEKGGDLTGGGANGREGRGGGGETLWKKKRARGGWGVGTPGTQGTRDLKKMCWKWYTISASGENQGHNKKGRRKATSRVGGQNSTLGKEVGERLLGKKPGKQCKKQWGILGKNGPRAQHQSTGLARYEGGGLIKPIKTPVARRNRRGEKRGQKTWGENMVFKTKGATEKGQSERKEIKPDTCQPEPRGKTEETHPGGREVEFPPQLKEHQVTLCGPVVAHV